MVHELTPDIPPDNLNPAPLGTLSGNWNDDDQAALDDNFSENTEAEVPEWTGLVHTTDETPKVTRILSNYAPIGTRNAVVAEPVMLFPRDPNRKKLVVYSANNVTFALGSAKSDVYGSNAAQVVANMQQLDLGAHTGALWVYSLSANPCDVYGYAVTE